MWVADSFDDKIYAYKMSDKTRDSGKDFNTLIAAGNGHPSALWSDGTTMWVADSDDDKIYAYNLATKQRDAGKDFNTLADAGNTASRGIWSNGATMWVAELGNNTNNTLYAYNLETKERDAYRDFNTLTAAGNTDARGIWSDGATMWVADAGDDKIYSYNMWPQSDSNDATLSTLTVIPTDIIGFAGDTDSYHTDSYHVGVANSVSQITITATANEANATIAWSSTDAGTAAGHQVTLSEGLNTVTITVTAEDTFTEKTYTIYVGRGVTTAFGWKATDDFNGLTPKFTGARGLWSDGETMWVTNDSFDKIDAYKMSDKTRDSGKDFPTLYDAEDNRFPFPFGLWSDGTTMWVADPHENRIFAYKMSDKTRDSGKELTNSDLSLANQGPWGLWSNGATIWVADRVVKRLFAYTLPDKTRRAGDFTFSNSELTAVSGDFGFGPSGIWSDGETMWVANDNQITAVPKIYAYSMITHRHLPHKDFNTLAAAGNTYPTGLWSDGQTMWVGDDRSGQKIYSYNMPKSDNADLRELSLSGITLNEDFSAGTTAYTATTAAASTTVTATPLQASATVAISPADADADDGHQVTLADNAVTTITVTVTAQDGETSKVYTVAVTRGTPPADSTSSNADLSGLTISPGTLMPGFTSSNTSYTASVGYGVASVTVTPTVSDTGKAHYTVNGGAQDTATEVELSVGANTITITVTAEDESTQDYAITVTRGQGHGQHQQGRGGGDRGGRAELHGDPRRLAGRAADSDGQRHRERVPGGDDQQGPEDSHHPRQRRLG